MSSLEKRAWLTLWSMCPAYGVYFAVQIAAPGLFTTLLQRLGFLAVVASVHALVHVIGLLAIRHGERGEELLADERDRAIDARATRAAYFVLLTGLIVVGVVMPFSDSGWKLVNAALFWVVLAEAMRNALIVLGYRRKPRLAH